MDGSVLVERDRELDAVDAALDLAAGGAGGVLALEGPAGVGKTALLRRAVRRAERRAMQVLVARAGEFEQEFAHGVARQLFERRLAEATPDERESLFAGPAALTAPLLGFARDPVPSLGPSTPDAFAMLHGLYWLVANLAEQGPVLLAVDDAHWADAPSLQLLAYLARRVDALPVLVAVSVRSGEAGTENPVMTTLLADPATIRVTPSPLSETGCVELLRAALGSEPDAAFARACAAATAGNPFLLEQLADAVTSHDLEPTAAAAARVADLGLRTVARATLLRLSRLPAPARALANALAVLGPEARLRDAAHVAGLDLGVAGVAADELRRIDIVSGDTSLDFLHPLVRSAVYRDLTAAERSDAHRRAAEALRAAGAAAADVAPHLLSVAPQGSADAVDLLCAAGREALERGGAEAAVQLLRRALAEPPAVDRRAAVLADLGDAEIRAGDFAAADEHLAASVAATDDPPLRCARRLLLARARSTTAGPVAAAELLEAGRGDAGGDPELALLVETEIAGLSALDDRTGTRAQARLRRYADLAGATPAERRMLATLSREAYLAGRPAAEAIELARRGLAGDLLVREAGPESSALQQTILVAIVGDDIATARAAIDACLATARDRGSALGFAYASTSRGLMHQHVGDVAAAEADAREALEALSGHDAYVRRILAAVLVNALIARGDLDGAEAALRDVGALGDLAEPALPTSRIQFARAALHLEAGRVDDAVADLRQIAAREAHWRTADREVPWRGLLALAYHRLGDAEAAERIAREHAAVAESWGTPTFVGRALCALGAVLEGDEAVAALSDAVVHLERSPARAELAHALAELGGALRRAGRRDDAREPLRQAIELAGACRATALQRRAHDELVTAGARPRRLQFSGADALTASERRVADMAAAGQSNREIAQALFVTVKTVENHLGRAYGKLGIRSREALAAALGEPTTTAA